MNSRANLFRSFAFAVVFSLGAAVTLSLSLAHGGTIAYLGQDTSTHADWRNDGVDKPGLYDPDGDELYGSDGYYVAFMGESGQGSAIEIKQLMPSFVVDGSVQPGLGGTWTANGYAWLNDPGEAVQPTNIRSGLWYQGGSGEKDLFDFTLDGDADFVLGAISNTHNVGQDYNLAQIRVREDGGTADTGLIAIDHTSTAAAYYTFFRVSGAAGDTFVVSGNGTATTIVTGLTFERVPEPGALALVMLAVPVLAFGRRRAKRY
jgi:hypothetical protein